MERIEIHFSEVMNLSKQISSIATAVKQQAEGNLQRISLVTKRVWQGESADLLAKKEVKINQELTREAEILQNLSRELEEKAREMYRIENANRLLAQARIYS